MDNGRRTLLAVHAHPDDEAFSMGGTFAKLANQGTQTVLVCATRGDVGEIHDPDLDPEQARQRLGEIREGELRRAVAILGISDLYFLGYRDSGMAGTPENADRRNFHNADPEEATQRLARLVRQSRPQVVVTYDERGGYGHPDHIAVHRTTLAALEAAADAARYPEEELPPWRVQKLYFTAWPRSAFLRMQEELQRRGIPTPFQEHDMDPATFTVPDEQITTRINVQAYLAQKREALRAHRTQLGEDHFALTMADGQAQETFGIETYVRVWSDVPSAIPEDDLFAGIGGS